MQTLRAAAGLNKTIVCVSRVGRERRRTLVHVRVLAVLQLVVRRVRRVDWLQHNTHYVFLLF